MRLLSDAFGRLWSMRNCQEFDEDTRIDRPRKGQSTKWASVSGWDEAEICQLRRSNPIQRKMKTGDAAGLITALATARLIAQIHYLNCNAIVALNFQIRKIE